MTIRRTSIAILPVERDAFARIWPIFQAVVAAGDTYAYPAEWGIEEARGAWFAPGSRTYIARTAGRVVGTYTLKPNQPGHGAHIANAAFMVAPEARGAGVGQRMGRHALAEARRAGYLGMQFNMVVASNAPALRLWRRLGFAVVGRVPRAFRAPDGRLTDVLIMYRDLDASAPESPEAPGTFSGQEGFG